MFESAELGHTVSKAAYEREVEALRPALLAAQYALLDERSFPVIMLVNGVEGAGKGETVNLLNAWLDPRHVRSHAFDAPTREEQERPPMWRYWQTLPESGKIGILFGSWYTDPINARVRGGGKSADLAAAVTRIRRFEKILEGDGAVLVKLWFHLSKPGMKKRLKELESSELTSWRVTKKDWESYARYDDYTHVCDRVLRETSTASAPWIVIDGTDPNYRELTAAKTLLGAVQRGLAGRAKAKSASASAKTRTAKKASEEERTPRVTPLFDREETARILRDLPFTERLSKESYAPRIAKAQAALAKISRSRKASKRAVVVVFEGMDAAGKGGAIRRVTQALDARRYQVIPIAAPSDEERAHPYLWRFWRHLPRSGRFVLYDRSWYGRVLVERVEGFATEDAWSRSYGEINDFEEQLVDSGAVVVKFWLAVTKAEQLRRFKEREATEFKQHKITKEDWRNRKKWDDYIVAASDMIDRTSTSIAPWTVIEADDKHLARVRVVETLTARIKEA